MIRTRHVVALALTLTACDETPEEQPPAAVYTVRGEVRSVSEESDRHYLSLHHEAIPTFRSREGETVGMHAMTMNFEVVPEVALDDVATGDAVEVTFEMRWQEGSELRITSLTKLPEGIALELENASSDPHDH